MSSWSSTDGRAIDYLWREMLTWRSLTDILASCAQVVKTQAEKGRKRRTQVWPRYQQLDVSRGVLTDAGEHGVGRRDLIPALGGPRQEQLDRPGA